LEYDPANAFWASCRRKRLGNAALELLYPKGGEKSPQLFTLSLDPALVLRGFDYSACRIGVGEIKHIKSPAIGKGNVAV